MIHHAVDENSPTTTSGVSYSRAGIAYFGKRNEVLPIHVKHRLRDEERDSTHMILNQIAQATYRLANKTQIEEQELA
jgi:hypothetical protein